MSKPAGKTKPPKHAEQVEREVKKISKAAIIGVLAGTILFIILIAFLGIKIKFIVEEELKINLKPVDKSLLIRYNDVEVVPFTLSTANFMFCRSYCSYSLTDTSTNSVVSQQSRLFKHKEEITEAYHFNTSSIGSGQAIYSFDVECHNVKSLLCLTGEQKYVKSSFITLNYDLSDREKLIEQKLMEDLTSHLEALKELDIIRQVNNMLSERFPLYHDRISIDEIREISRKNSLLDEAFSKQKVVADEYRNAWETQKYLDANWNPINESEGKLKVLHEKLINHSRFINSTILLHNVVVGLAAEIAERTSHLSDIAGYYAVTSQEGAYEKIISIAETAKNNVKSVESFAYFSYPDAKRNMDSALNLILSEENEYIDNQAIFSANGSFYAYLSSTLLTAHPLCSINCSTDETNNSESPETFSSFDDMIAIKPGTDSTKKICMSIKQAADTADSVNAKAIQYLNANYPEYSDNAQFKNILEAYTENALISALNKIRMESVVSSTAPEENSRKYFNALLNYSLKDESAIPSTDEDNPLSNISGVEWKKMAIIKIPGNTARFYNEYCLNINSTQAYNLSFKFDNENIFTKTISTNITKNISSQINTSLIEHKPQCCVFGECRQCCTYETCSDKPELYPIIFIHGHAFNKDNSPELSMNSFAKLQKKLEEEGYINAGQIDMSYDPAEIPEGEWGRSGWPITVRASYYYINYLDLGIYAVTTQKSENIENYAIRLKEIIDLIKYRTGMDKVNIVAHSMGGLVAREYLALFGDENVNKLIMIATPNHGIGGKVNRLCSLLGNSKECTAMSSDSIFLKRLNTAVNIPKNAEVYTITATGCDMDGQKGDGIVLANDVPLSYAENKVIRGKCTDALKSNLHTRILDSDSYPAIHEAIKIFLKK